ncbi:PIN domain-containing protein [Streptomyces zaomyceticus]|uniref:PIN domain-containing protein n=1 Tax=Streptomyces zaomyceticus TaxID=68286 RepID=UPI003798652F
MIVLDSNQIRLFLPGTPALRQLAAVATKAGHTIATTDMVFREVVRQHHARLLAAAKALSTGQREFNELVTSPEGRARVPFSDSRLRHGFARREIRAFETAFHEAYRVLPTLPEDALKALQWEADHRGPCRNGTGARDAAIWLSAERACETPDLNEAGRRLPVIFVSGDNDFSAPGDPSSLAEDLRSDHTRSGMMKLKKGVVDVLVDLGYPKRRVDAQKITDLPDFRNALFDAAMDEGGLSISAMNMERLGDAEIGIHLRRGAEAYECRGNDMTLTSIQGTWGVRVVIERLPRRPDGRAGGQRLLGRPMEIEATALLVENHEQQTTTIEIFPTVTW